MMYAGICNYPEHNTWSKVLINKHIDQIAKSFVGVPVVVGHNQPRDMNDPMVGGVVERVFCNSEGILLKDGTKLEPDGKYYCEFSAFKQDSIDAADKLGAVSTSWTADKVIVPEVVNGEREKFEYLGLPYEVEIETVNARHLAIVGKPRYEDAVIYENSKDNIMEIESKIELEKGVFLSFVSSAADKGKALLTSIFNNAKKKDNSDEEELKKIKELEEMEKEEIKEKKMDNKKSKNNKKKDNESEDMEESKENESKDEEDSMDNSVDIDGEKVSMEELKNCYKASKKKDNEKKEDTKDNSKGEEEIDLKEIESKTFNNSSEKTKYRIGASSMGKEFYM